MKAMILAAGLGTRLRPLTDNRPKALVEINGRTMLEITLSRLRGFGVREVIINVFHFADMIEQYLNDNNNFGLTIEVSREETLLDTGGGLKKAAYFFLSSSPQDSRDHSTEVAGKSDDPFIVHNVDVLSTIDLQELVQVHKKSGALATLAVQDRKSSRQLFFDNRFQLCGRRSGNGHEDVVGTAQPAHALAFSGIHVISPRLLPMLSEDGAFSIVNSYMRLAGSGEKIMAYPADKYYWRDLGTPESLAQAAEDLRRGQLV
jgi:NDP-sugar pyrophosphorylase family protein